MPSSATSSPDVTLCVPSFAAESSRTRRTRRPPAECLRESRASSGGVGGTVVVDPASTTNTTIALDCDVFAPHHRPHHHQPLSMSNLDPRMHTAGTSNEDEVLLEPYSYLCQIPGKEVRKLLINAFDLWLQIPADKTEAITNITRMLHNASLLVDDIEDNSHLRRGVPVAHKVYGVAQTINASNYVYFLALAEVMKLSDDSRATVTVFTENLLELHRGQGWDIVWRDSLTCPSEEEYRTMVTRKTGGLFRLGVSLMQLFSDCKHDFNRLIDDLGLYFQVRDDYANLLSEEYADNKSFAEDLTEGKFSFPIIYAITHDPSSKLLNILRQKPTDINLKKYFIETMSKLGAFEYTERVLGELDEAILSEVERLGGNAVLVTLMERLRKVHRERRASTSQH